MMHQLPRVVLLGFVGILALSGTRVDGKPAAANSETEKVEGSGENQNESGLEPSVICFSAFLKNLYKNHSPSMTREIRREVAGEVIQIVTENAHAWINPRKLLNKGLGGYKEVYGFEGDEGIMRWNQALDDVQDADQKILAVRDMAEAEIAQNEDGANQEKALSPPSTSAGDQQCQD